MKYWLYFTLAFLLSFCQKGNETVNNLPQSGIWVNYKYPLYLRDIRAVRYVQDQIFISAVEFRGIDSLVWVQFHLREWVPFKLSYLSERHWLLHQDSSNLDIPIQATLNSNGLIVAYDLFQPALHKNTLGVARAFYADEYQIGVQRVRFYDNGKVVGLDSFVAFEPIIDYTLEAGKEDRILLKTASGSWKKFGLVLSDWNSLEIYDLKKDNLDKLLYRIYRQVKPINLD